MSLSTAAAMRVMKELRALTSKPPEGIRVYVNEDNISTVVADIDGPVGTPFEGGVFRCKLVLGADFPAAPPKGLFTTKLFHPNVSAAGEICVNTLKKDWQPTLGLGHVLLVIRCLLIDPNPASALNEEAGKLLNEDYDAFAKRAQLMTKIHATKGGVAAASGAAAAAPQPKPVAPVATASAADNAKANTKAADVPATVETKNPVIAKDNKENAAAAAAAVNAAAKKPAAAATAAVVPGKPVAPTAAAAAAKPATAASSAAATAAAAKKKALKRL